MKASEIRKKYVEFFGSQGHEILPSASLVPVDDPSLLWINAGMAPLKKYFEGREIPRNPRMTSSQKCIRTNDIENVGKTARHQTFFEMLGNFSIGDYFKKEAIHWAWEFLVEHLRLEPDRLSVTIHPEDDEAYAIWHREVGIPSDRIVRMDDNFWDIGEGPCGPCSEIFYDRGPETGCGQPTCQIGCDCDRYLEIWNLVFSQYNHNPDGTYTPLPKKNIDTGMGLERVASVMQNVETNFDTDLFRPIIDETCALAGVTYGKAEHVDVALKVIADHVRTVVFAVGDGVSPTNEGRGYVIRRLLRRAVRFGKVIGITRPFLYQLVGTVGRVMGDEYPEVVERKELIQRVIRAEEERFHETLSEGEQLLGQIIAYMKESGQKVLRGEEAFKLYDTFGFPIDLTEDIARENGITVDRDGFEAALAEQRERGRLRVQAKGGFRKQSEALLQLDVPSQFVGYTDLSATSRVVAILRNGAAVSQVAAGDVCQLVLDRTPFYAESGGQVPDRGMIVGKRSALQVEDVQKAPHGQHVHTCTVLQGELAVGETVDASIDRLYREDVMKNHTATHLLHKALREVLGDHVTQAGSLVASDRLRFDFSHFGALTDEQLRDIERRVNEQIWRNEPVEIREMPLDQAKALGAMALFGEKYGDVVRVVKAGDYSIELCGGCHVTRTGQIGLFRLVSETGIGAGVRRIEAVTGRHAYQYLDEQARLLAEAAARLKSSPADVPARIDVLFSQIKDLERESEMLKSKLGRLESQNLLGKAAEVDGIPYIAAEISGMDMEGLRTVADQLKGQFTNGVIVLGSVHDNKVQFVAVSSPSCIEQGISAGTVIKQVAAMAGGGGGGRPDMAQAGAKDPAKIGAALASVPEIIRRLRK